VVAAKTVPMTPKTQVKDDRLCIVFEIRAG
jgi:hypothetical protein